MALNKTFSVEFEERKEWGRESRRHKKDRLQGVRAALAKPGQNLDDVATLRANQDLRCLLSLRASVRHRLLGGEKVEIGRAMQKLGKQTRKNQRHSKEKEKGLQAKTQRAGRGKAESYDRDSMGGGRFTSSVDPVNPRRRPEKGGAETGSWDVYASPLRVLDESEREQMAKVKEARIAALHKELMAQVADGAGGGATGPSALALRKAGTLPKAPEAHVGNAAAKLRRLAPQQRPASLPALITWLKRNHCCQLRFHALMPPGALAAAMLPLLEDRPQLQGALRRMAGSSGADEHGPAPEEVQKVARLQVAQLKRVEKLFFQRSFGGRCRWLADASLSTISMTGEDLAAELISRQLVAASSDGKLGYDEEKLAQAQPPLDGVWKEEDFQKTMDEVLIEAVSVDLGDLAILIQERVKNLRASGKLEELGRRWVRGAAKTLGEGNLDMATARVAFAPPRYMKSICIVTAAAGPSAEWFAEEVGGLAQQEMRRSSPLVVELKNVEKMEHGLVPMLQNSLNCRITYTCPAPHDIWVVFSEQGVAPERGERLKEVMQSIFGREAPFHWPSAVSRSLCQLLVTNTRLLWDANRSGKMKVHLELVEDTNANGANDLRGWPSFSILNEADGLTKYLSAASGPAPQGLQEFLGWAKEHPDVEMARMIAECDNDVDFTNQFAEEKLLRGGKVVLSKG